MYENFTTRSGRVMQLSTEEARQLNNNCVDSGALLLGLIREGGGIAAHVLLRQGLELVKVRVELTKWVSTSDKTKSVSQDCLPLTPVVERIIKHATQEMQSLGDSLVGTEHLLLGLLRECSQSKINGPAEKLFANFKLPQDEVREEIIRLVEESRKIGLVVAEKASEHQAQAALIALWLDLIADIHCPSDKLSELSLVLCEPRNCARLRRVLMEAKATITE